MTQAWLPPEIEPLIRLRVAHGTLIDAEGWQLAHGYHRDRQNLLYQSLYRGGIERGLEVYPLAASENVPAPYREGCWVQVQPGIAIDSYGNIIVVPEPIDFRFASRVTGVQEREIFLILRYVDPEQLQGVFKARVRETFRLDETSSPPQAGEIELCRVRLRSDSVQLVAPTDPLDPEAGTIDARFRPSIRPRPETVARVGIWGQDGPSARVVRSRFVRLLRACEGLYPELCGGEREVDLLPANSDASALGAYNPIYLTDAQAAALDARHIDALKQYLTRGGNIWIEISPDGGALVYLSVIEARLRSQLDWAKTLASADEIEARLQVSLDLEAIAPREPTALREEGSSSQSPVQSALARESRLEAELAKTRAALAQECEQLSASAHQLAERLGIVLTPWESLERDRPEPLYPFQFDALPSLNHQLFQLWCGRGITVVLGDLSAAWGTEHRIALDRLTIRTAQELGINLLHAACRRRQIASASFNPQSPSDHA